MANFEAYLPRGAWPLLARARAGLPVADDLEGVVLYADLADFTAISETLAASGQIGAESLQGLLNDYFSILISHVIAAGGEVTTFAGDALAAIFPDGPSGRACGARRAARCATEMQSALSVAPGIHLAGVDLRPRMKIGLGGGAVTRALVGSLDVRVLHVLAGIALDRAVDAQNHSREGEVVADAGLVGADTGAVVAGTRDGWWVLKGSPETAAHAAIDHTQRRPSPTPSQLSSAPGPGSAARAHDFGDEHRMVTSVFSGMPDMDLPGDGGARLQDYLSVALPAVQRYDGDLRQVDAGDKGYQLVIGFGAPRSSADDAERAVACCLELVRQAGGPFRAGVATGPAFCAEVGSDERREYVVLGASVNLAARLAQSARPGEVRIDAVTALRTAAFTSQHRLGGLRVKGRRAPVEAFAVSGLREADAAVLPAARGSGESFIGRERELAAGRGCLERARRGQGQVLLVTGEPGIGKSRLAAELLVDADRGWAVATGAGSAPGDTRTYLAWRSIWRSLLSEPGKQTNPQAALRTALTIAGEEDERAPLLGPVLGIPMPDNAFTAALDPAARADATRAILLTVLRQRASAAPVTIVVDDCQWLDELSRLLLEFLAANLADRAVLLVVVARDEPSVRNLLAHLRGLVHCTSLPLRDMPPSDAERLVSDRLKQAGDRRDEPASWVSHIAARGGGNPLFLEELVSYLRDHAGDPGPGPAVDLPQDVRRLVLARVDRLLPHGQATLKTASVIGERFSASSVQGSLTLPATAEQVSHDLARLLASDLVRLLSDTPEPTYSFRHAVVQEVVYGSLSSATRCVLHEAVGGYFERTYAHELAPWASVLAHHYGHGRNADKQRTWFRAAGDAARAAYANEAALDYYQRLLPLLPEPDHAEVLVRIGALWQLTGRWEEAEAALREAVMKATTTGQESVQAEAERELGIVLLGTRKHGEAVESLQAAARSFARLQDPGGECQALDRLAFALFEHGDYPAALEVAQRQLAVQGNLNDQAGMSAALENNALLHWRVGDYGPALVLMRRAYVLARRSRDRRLIVHTANDLAGLYAERGNHSKAVKHLQEAITVAKHIGYREATAYLTGNAGELYRERGAYEEAKRYFAAGLQAALEIGDWITTVHCASALAMTAADQQAPGHHELLERATAIAGQLHRSHVLADVMLRQAQAALDCGDLVRAQPLAEQAENVARHLSERGQTLRPRLLRFRVEVASGRLPVDHAVRDIESLMTQWSEPPERALLLDTIAQLDPTAESCAAAAADLYRDLYRQAPSIQYAAAYRRLSGGRADLPPAPPLPSLGAVMEDTPVDVHELFTRIERLTATDEADRG